MTREEATELIERLPYLPTLTAQNERARIALYTQAIAENDPIGWARVVKSCHLRSLYAPKRAQSEAEIVCAGRAKRLLHSTLAYALGIGEDSVEDYIARQLDDDF